MKYFVSQILVIISFAVYTTQNQPKVYDFNVKLIYNQTVNGYSVTAEWKGYGDGNGDLPRSGSPARRDHSRFSRNGSATRRSTGTEK